MKRILITLLSAAFAAVLVFGGLWLHYVTMATDPFDEVGIEINSRMPTMLNEWGCAQLKARFGTTTIPPMGCGNGTQW